MSTQTFRDRVAEFFRAHPGEWIDAQVLMTIGGSMGWRTRISNARRQLHMTIDNKIESIARADGSHYTRSRYRYLPPAAATVRDLFDAAS